MNYSKLAELRAKTDRQLAVVIGRRLDVALRYSRRALHPQAIHAHGEARKLMTLVRSIGPGERGLLESKLARVEAILEESSADRLMQSACC